MITKIKKNQQVMVPIHIKITEEMRDLLAQVAKNHGFPRIQGLIRLYIRRGLDAENVRYSLARQPFYRKAEASRGIRRGNFWSD